MEKEYKRYYGVMDYFATGEGHQQIWYVAWSDSEENFRNDFIRECQIHEYFQIGIEIFDTISEETPPLVVQYWRDLRDGAGFMKFHSYLNYS